MFDKGMAPKWKSESGPRAQECSDRKMLKSQSPRAAKVDSNGVDLDERESGEESAKFCTKVQKALSFEPFSDPLGVFTKMMPDASIPQGILNFEKRGTSFPRC